MQVNEKLMRPTIVILALSALTATMLLLPSRGVSIDWGAGGGGWLDTAYANQHSALCAQNDPNDRCQEWCEIVNGRAQGTGQLCCVSPNGVCHPQNVFWP